MKLLPLEPTYRMWLNSRVALSLDGELNERFAGLTYSESVLYAEMSNPPFTSFEQWDAETLTHFLHLHERHELSLAFRVALQNHMGSR
jgi:hypothetical protein